MVDGVLFVDDGVGGVVAVGAETVVLFVGGVVVEFTSAHQPHLHPFR